MLPPRAPLPPIDPADFAARIAIVVPYRDRRQHLARFLPHLVTFFERDALARAIPYEIHIVEQAPGGSFNRGALKNAGFALAHRNADCVVFHDVDYLPVWADYSRVRCPTSLIAYGVEGASEVATETPGCVVAMPVADFLRINGYSNDYTGWGYEDLDLQERIARAGLAWAKRGGTFSALPHPHHGLDAEGKLGAEGQHTRAIFKGKLSLGNSGFGPEGLSTLSFRVEATLQWSRNGVVQPQIMLHRVALG